MTRRVLTILLAAAVLAVAMPVYASGNSAEAQLEADLTEIMESHNLDESNIAFGYRRTTDWRQIWYNEDTLFQAASVYKLALNMYYYEQEAAGLISPDAAFNGVPLSQCHQQSLQYSNNDLSQAMLDSAFPDFSDYKRMAAAYAGIDEDHADEHGVLYADAVSNDAGRDLKNEVAKVEGAHEATGLAHGHADIPCSFAHYRRPDKAAEKRAGVAKGDHNEYKPAVGAVLAAFSIRHFYPTFFSDMFSRPSPANNKQGSFCSV